MCLRKIAHSARHQSPIEFSGFGEYLPSGCHRRPGTLLIFATRSGLLRNKYDEPPRLPGLDPNRACRRRQYPLTHSDLHASSVPACHLSQPS